MKKTIQYKIIEDVQLGGNSYFRVKWKWGIFWISLKEYSWWEKVEGVWETYEDAANAMNEHYKDKRANTKSYTSVENIIKGV
ncbi:MAG: hypothetical protein [Cystoviridae sp.]|nr:MAG: hypothetical protein [Cystoviridae sp.]